MKKFVNLTLDEVNRNKHLYTIAVTLLVIGEIVAIYLSYRRILKMNLEMIRLQDIFLIHSLVPAVIFVGVVLLMIMTLFIWFREWSSQGRFIYRLLTLPGNRPSIAWAKWASMMLLGLFMMAIQMFLMVIVNQVMDLVNPDYQNIGMKTPLVMEMPIINLIVPINFPSLLFILLTLSLLILVLSNVQLLFFSQLNHSKMKALGVTLIYLFVTILSSGIIIMFLILDTILKMSEAVWIIFAILVIFNGLHGYLMSWLMKHYARI